LRDFFGFRRDIRGTTAVEYALIAALIAVVIVVAVGTAGSNLAGLYNSVAISY
jgi:pilus assembly protein Flp/PilA